MPKPVLLTVDDDPEVLRAIERDLRKPVCGSLPRDAASSGSAGLATLRELKARNNPVALLLADQRMPQMDGVNFLAEAMENAPARQEGAAYRVRGYECRHRRHQRGARALLPDEAVGSSRGKTFSRTR